MRNLKFLFSGALCLLIFVACGNSDNNPGTPEDPFAGLGDTFAVTISVESPELTIGESVTISVTASNPTDSTVYFGYGSSLCNFSGAVRIEGQDCHMYDDRGCSQDMGRLELAPGEIRREQWDWDGSYQYFLWDGDVYVGAEDRVISSGTYEIRGRAGFYLGPLARIVVID